MKQLIIRCCLYSIVFSSLTVQPHSIDIDTQTGCFIAAGAAAACTLSGIIGWQCSNAKYVYQQEKDKHDRIEREEQKKQEDQTRFEQKQTAERHTLHETHYFLKPFQSLIQRYMSREVDTLADHRQFQQSLTHLICGHNDQPNRISTLNQQIRQLEHELLHIENETKQDEAQKLLQVLSWLKYQINASAQARSTEDQIQRAYYARRKEKFAAEQQNERYKQERIQTETIHKEAQARQQAAHKITHLAHSLENIIGAIRTDLNEQLAHIGHTHDHHMQQLNGWQAHHEVAQTKIQHQLREIHQAFNHVQPALHSVDETSKTLQHFIHTIMHAIAQIDENQKQQTAYIIQELQQALHGLPVFEQHADMPQPSAPPFGPEDK